jgi:hypothetical protein
MSVDRAAILEKLSLLPDRLQRLVDQHPHDLLCQAGAGGSWGAVEIMAFLRDWNEVTRDRIAHMLGEDSPELDDPDPDLWSIERDYPSEKPEPVVTALRENRNELLETLQKLDDEQWERIGRLPDDSTVTIEDLIIQLHESDQEQYRALRELLT